MLLCVDGAVYSDVGQVRDRNEDNYYLNGIFRQDTSLPVSRGAMETSGSFLCAICDGMGGAAHGELASLLAVANLADVRPGDIPNQIPAYLERANSAICRERQATGVKSMGTTVAALAVNKNGATAFNLGDSRVYQWHRGELTRLSHDHTEGQSRLDSGLNLPKRGRGGLTQHLGIPPKQMILEPHVVSGLELNAGDRFLLCSDGLTDPVEERELCAILSEPGSSSDLANRLVSAALANGGTDNITALVVTIFRRGLFSRRGENRRSTRKG